jgi:hypothetical protein
MYYVPLTEEKQETSPETIPEYKKVDLGDGG